MSACTNYPLPGGKLSIGQRSKSCEDFLSYMTTYPIFFSIDDYPFYQQNNKKLDGYYSLSDCDSGQFTSSISLSSSSNKCGSKLSLNKYESTSSLYESYESVPSFSQYKPGLILSKNVSAPNLSENESALNLSKDELAQSPSEVVSALKLSKDEQAQSPSEVVSALKLSKDEQAQSPSDDESVSSSSTKYESAPSLCNDESSSGSSSYESVSSSAEGDVVTKCMDDFVIVHTDDDLEKATECKEEIIEDLKAKEVTVHLLSEIGHGKTIFQSIESLHNQYRYILVYVSESLVHDKQFKFLIEILIMAGLNGKENNEYRVVPIFTNKGSYNYPALDVIKGINYYQRNTCNGYLSVLHTFLKLARERFPRKL